MNHESSSHTQIRTQIGDDGVSYISRALHRRNFNGPSSALADLTLSLNDLTEAAGPHIASTIQSLEGSLQALDVSINNLGANGVDALRNAITSRRLIVSN